jgi:basic amino acid/polyamine antiporter, APA family
LGTFRQILSYFIFVTVLFVALTVVALFVLRRRARASAPPAFRTPGYPVTPVVFLVLVAVLLLLLVGHDPAQALLGVAIVGLGLPVYFFVFRRRLTPPLDDTT